jgi:hypothetical protein
MRRKNIVISGSVVLWLLLPGLFRPRDIDAYVPKGILAEVHAFLELNTEYRLLYDRPRSRGDYGYEASVESGA